MTELILNFFISAFVILVAGIFLGKSADRFAELTGFGRLLVGSVLLAGATSLPELSIDVSAVLMDMPDIAVGNILGSCLLNLLVLGIGDLISKQKFSLLSRQAAKHALSGSVNIGLLAITGIAILSSRHLTFSFMGIGLGSFALLLGFAGGIRMVYFDQRFYASAETKTIRSDPDVSKALIRCIAIFVIAASAIFIAGPELAKNAGDLAELTGLSKTFVGTVLVAFCTILPELVATVTAVRLGSFDLALGNIFGSNTFNMLILVILDFFHQGPIFSAISPVHVITALSVILCTSVAVMGQLYNLESRHRFIDPDALLIISLVIGCIALLYKLSALQF